jgi:glycerophosphoryl diester phosphodiesterase
MSKILAVAHSGCMGTWDDGLESVEKAIECNADVVEIDIRFDQNNTPVLGHDDLKEGNHYEKVYDALAIFSKTKNMLLNCDMKEKDNIEGLRTLKEYFEKFEIRKRMYFSGIEKCEVGYLKEVFPDYTYVTDWNFNLLRLRDRKYILGIINHAKAAGFVGLNLHHMYVNRKVATTCQEEGFKLYTWTVESRGRMEKLARWGVDAITSKNILLLQEVLREYK